MALGTLAAERTACACNVVGACAKVASQYGHQLIIERTTYLGRRSYDNLSDGLVDAVLTIA